ncbi:MAG: aminotransferase class V-fold PLP-dependent enzyme [Planctomycetaceae bacterium]
MPRIYLDNAATSFPKPESVYAAIDDYNRRLGAAAGRGAYRSSLEAAEIVRRCRLNLARLFNAEGPDRFAFAFNGTDALNIALHGLLRPGDHVVTTVVEHNSVLRPLRSLADRGVAVTIVDCDETGRVSPEAVRAAIRPATKLVVATHASNVTGTIQPVADIVELAKAAGAYTLLDAAQSAGHLPIDLGDLPVDLLAASGHKGLLGPLGTGVLYVRPTVEEHLAPLRQGGTGTASEDDRQPTDMPERLEAGNLNVSGIAGLEASSRWLLERGVESVRRHEQELTGRLVNGLRSIRSIGIFGPEQLEDRAGIVSIVAEEWVPQDLAAVLDAEFGVEARAGLHCAPLIHRRFGSTSRNGLLRMSVGAFTSTDDVDVAIAAMMAFCET